MPLGFTPFSPTYALANPVDSVAALEKLYANAAAALKQRYNRP